MNIHDKYAVHPQPMVGKRISPIIARRIRDQIFHSKRKGLTSSVDPTIALHMKPRAIDRHLRHTRPIAHQVNNRQHWGRSAPCQQKRSQMDEWYLTPRLDGQVRVQFEPLTITDMHYVAIIDGHGEIDIHHKRFVCLYQRNKLEGIDGYAVIVKDHITINVREDLSYELQLIVIYDLVHMLKQQPITIVLYKLPEPYPHIQFSSDIE